MRILPDNKCKTNVNLILCDKTYFFIYDLKTTETGQLPDLKMFYITNFYIYNSIAIKV